MSLPSLKTRARLSRVRQEIRGEPARRAQEPEAGARRSIGRNVGNVGKHVRVALLPEAPVSREVFARIDRMLSRRAEASPRPCKAEA